jgi:hypothetical protein
LGKTINIYYNIDEPPLVAESQINLAFLLPPELLKIKLKALKAHTSQTADMFAKSPISDIKKAFRLESFSTA